MGFLHRKSVRQIRLSFLSMPELILTSFRPDHLITINFLDSGFHVTDSGFQVLDSNLCQWNLDSGFRANRYNVQNPH